MLKVRVLARGLERQAIRQKKAPGSEEETETAASALSWELAGRRGLLSKSLRRLQGWCSRRRECAGEPQGEPRIDDVSIDTELLTRLHDREGISALRTSLQASQISNSWAPPKAMRQPSAGEVRKGCPAVVRRQRPCEN